MVAAHSNCTHPLAAGVKAIFDGTERIACASALAVFVE